MAKLTVYLVMAGRMPIEPGGRGRAAASRVACARTWLASERRRSLMWTWRSGARRAFRLPGLCLLILLVAGTVRGVGFNTTLDRNVVPVGETVTLNLIFEGATPNSAPSLSELQLPNVQLVPGGISQSSQITFVNGQQTIQATFSYTLQALQPGDVTIPALQFSVNGQ